MSDFDRHPYLKTPNCEPVQSVSTPHKWAEVIKAWADGKTVQFKSNIIPGRGWQDYDANNAAGFGPWYSAEGIYEWRVKPQTRTGWIAIGQVYCSPIYRSRADALKHFGVGHDTIAVIPVTCDEGEGL